MIKALCFDVFGSVVDWRGSLLNDLADYAREQDLESDVEDLVDKWREGYRPAMEKVRSGETPWTNLDDLHFQTLQQIITEQQVTDVTLEQLQYINSAWHRLKSWADSVPGLTTLRDQGFEIMPLSNGNTLLLSEMAGYAGLPWTRIISAEDFKRYKPDKEVYIGAIQMLGYRPDEVMMCASHNPDLAAARSNGMKTAFWPRATEFGPGSPDNQTMPTEDWDIVASDIQDLAVQLEHSK